MNSLGKVIRFFGRHTSTVPVWDPIQNKTHYFGGYTELEVNNTHWYHRYCAQSSFDPFGLNGKCVALGWSKSINLCAGPFNLSFLALINACSIKVLP